MYLLPRLGVTHHSFSCANRDIFCSIFLVFGLDTEVYGAFHGNVPSPYPLKMSETRDFVMFSGSTKMGHRSEQD